MVSGGQKDRSIPTTGASALSLLPGSTTLQPPRRAPHRSLTCLVTAGMTSHSGSARLIQTPRDKTTRLTGQHREPAHHLPCMQELPELTPAPANKAGRGQARHSYLLGLSSLQTVSGSLEDVILVYWSYR